MTMFDLSETALLSPNLSADLYMWYTDAVSSGYSYVAAMTRRCPNLLEAMLSNKPVEERAKFDHVLTETGLLLKARQIAEYCKNNAGAFPSIALLDDMLVHGRNLNNFLDSFFRLICTHLCELGYIYDEAELRKNFYNSITLWIFAINKAPIFLCPECQWRIHYRHIWPESTWRKFSFNISNFIWKSNVANTSYVISARVDAERPKRIPPTWLRTNAPSYRNGHQEFYSYPIPHVHCIYPTVRSYQRSSSRYYTPYFFTPAVHADQAARVMDLIFSRLKQAGCAHLEAFMKLIEQTERYEGLHAVYGQFFTLLLSQISLSVFLSEIRLHSEDVVFDTWRIARNFGFGEEIKPMLDALCKMQWDSDFLEQLCAKMEYPKKDSFLPADSPPKETLLDTMENIIYEQAVEHEACAWKLQERYTSGEKVDISEQSKTGELPVEEFLARVVSNTDSVSSDCGTIIIALSFLTQMMDCGDISLKMKAAKAEDGQFEFSSVERNTEMSLSIMPRKMMPYFSNFSTIVQFYWRKDDFLAQVEYYFCKFLPNYHADVEKYADLAKKFAELIQSNTAILNSLLNWGDIFEEQAFPASN